PVLHSLASFFYVMPRSLPLSPPFPYTTLFRSKGISSLSITSDIHFFGTINPADDFYLFGTDDIGRDIWSRLIFASQVSLSVGLVDRKSTRLNSSHVKISYAVFCLKKKKDIKLR